MHSTTRRESVDDERAESVADVIADDQISQIIEFGWLAIDNDESRTVPFGHQGESRRRPNDERRPYREKQIAILAQLLGSFHCFRRH
jgi:hypothetical protein